MDNLEPKTTLEKALFYPHLDKLASDMKFISIVSIIFAAISSILIVTIPITIIQIIAALRLKNGADDLKKYLQSEEFSFMKEAWLNIGKYMNLVKILFIVDIVAVVFGIIIMFMSSSFIFTKCMNII